MSRRRRDETEEQRARRELISDFLSAANIQSMDDIQDLSKKHWPDLWKAALNQNLILSLGMSRMT